MDFSAFLIPEPSDRSLSGAMQETRRKLRQVHVLDTVKLLSRLKDSLDAMVSARYEEHSHCDFVAQSIKRLRRRGVEGQRRNAALHMIFHRTQMKICQLRCDGFTRDFARTTAFYDFITNFDSETPPIIDLSRFETSLGGVDAKIDVLERRLSYIRPKLRELTAQKPGSGNWEFNLLHIDTKSGQVIKRFEERIGELSYDDVFLIVDHLSDERGTFRRIENLLFDLAWVQRDFPFGFRGKMTQTGSLSIPVRGDMFPAAVASTILEQEFAFTPFSALNGANWPFRRAVAMLFEMLVLRNPFEIARLFWDVIQEVARSMQMLMVKSGVSREDVEIDFDSLFPILMICVFAFGIDEWMSVALYTMSFNDHVGDEPQLQFAMTYLEGLVTHIIAIDPEALRRRAGELRKAWADDQSDPLGLA
jgi:hypothetical protein